MQRQPLVGLKPQSCEHPLDKKALDLRDLLSRLIVDVARCAPIREQVVRQHAEAGF